MTVILMSRSEIDRMNVLRDLAEERIRVSEAATLIGLGRRQVLRLAKAFRQRGPAALASRRRGKPSNRSYPGVLRTEVTGIIRECYADFGPTLAGEKLAELHGIRLAPATIRQWMMVAGLWKDRRQRKRLQVNQAAIVENKRLGPVLAYIAEKQKELDMSRSAKAPRRRGQRNHMFKVG